MVPAPPEAIMGIVFSVDILARASFAKPDLEPSWSIEVNSISPAPRLAHSLDQSNKSSSVANLPPFRCTFQDFEMTLASMATTRHCEPNSLAISLISSGLRTVAELTDTLSAPALRRV
jgi:hypothetical protein